MKKQLITFMGLKIMNFEPSKSKAMNGGDYYQDFVLKKNDSELCITYEFNAEKQFINGNVSFNGQSLKGREINIKDITNIIELM